MAAEFILGELSSGFWGHGARIRADGLGSVGSNVSPTATILLDNASIAEGASINSSVGTFTINVSTTGTAAWSLANSAGGIVKVNSTSGALSINSAVSLGTISAFGITAAVSGTTPDPADHDFTVYIVPTRATLDMIGSSDTGASSTDNITQNSTPTFDVTATLYEGDTVSFYDNGSLITAHQLTSTEATLQEINLGVALSNATHPITVDITRGGYTNTASSSVSVVVDTVSPILSSASGSATGSSTASAQIVTNETTNGGTLYWVMDQTSTTPTISQVKSGLDAGGTTADAHSSASVSASPVVVSATGLSASTTYYAFFMQEDTAGNQSSVAGNLNFTTNSAGGGFDIAWTASADDTGGGTTINYGTLSVGAADANRVVAIAIGDRNGTNNAAVSSVSIGGNAASAVTGAAAIDAAVPTHSDIWYVALPTGTTASVSVTYSTASTRSSIDVYRIITTTPTPSAGAKNTAASQIADTALAQSITVPAGGGGIAVYCCRAADNANDVTWTNATHDHTTAQLGTFTTTSSAEITGTGSVNVSARIAGSTTSSTNLMLSLAAWGP